MKAVTVEHLGEAGTFREVPMPEPGKGEILVRITAVGVNPIDWKLRDSGRRPMPFVLGQDFAGVVVGSGPEAYKYNIDDRVFGIARTHGAYAQFTTVPEDDNQSPVSTIPDRVGDADAAALPTAGLTALAAVEMLGVRDGMRVAIIGVTGGVGEFAAQMAHARGAYVIGAGHSRNEELAKGFGVDRFLAYDKSDVAKTLREMNDVDAVIDVVDDADAIKHLLKAVKPGGGIVSTIGSLNPHDWEALGVKAYNLVGADTPQYSHAGLRQLARMTEEGTLRVYIGAERDLQDAVPVLEQSKAGTIAGKIVLTVETGTI